MTAQEAQELIDQAVALQKAIDAKYDNTASLKVYNPAIAGQIIRSLDAAKTCTDSAVNYLENIRDCTENRLDFLII